MGVGTNNSQRGSREGPAEEPTDEYGGDILSDGDWNAENGEEEDADA